MHRAPINSEIRKLIVGPDPKLGFVFEVGKDIGPFEISRIVRHEDNYHLFGVLVYVIYCTNKGEEEEFAWKFFEGVPVSVECYAPNAKN